MGAAQRVFRPGTAVSPKLQPHVWAEIQEWESFPYGETTEKPAKPPEKPLVDKVETCDATSQKRPERPNGLPHSPEIHAEEILDEMRGPGGDDLGILLNVKGSLLTSEQGVKGIVGHTHDKDGARQIRGVLLYPTLTENPVVYAQDRKNLELAIRKRITEKQRKPALTKRDIANLTTFVRNACFGKDAIFSKELIIEWALANLHDLSLIASKKWSPERLRKAIEQLALTLDPSFNLSFNIKAEAMAGDASGAGKAPRLLIADGDAGQVMAFIVVKCFEDLLFSRAAFKTNSIKGGAKLDAVLKVFGAMRRKMDTVDCLEGDGSAWDTCCSLELRELIENPVMKWIGYVLMDNFIIPEEWVKSHEKINSKKSLTAWVFNSGKKATLDWPEKLKLKIDSIRRSGHRGTSCLNFWINLVLWHVCIYGARASVFLNPDRRNAEDIWGHIRWLMSGFEGDDSGLATTAKDKEGKHVPLRSHDDDIIKFWERCGFNMVLEHRAPGDKMLFAGIHVLVDKNGPTSKIMPDLKRFISNHGVTCSSSAIKAYNDGNVAGVKNLAAAKCLSRAYEWAGILQCIVDAQMMYIGNLTKQDGVKSKIELCHDEQMRCDGLDADGVEFQIAVKRNGQQHSDLELLKEFGYDVTQEQLEDFVAAHMTLDVCALPGAEEWLAHVPPSWI